MDFAFLKTHFCATYIALEANTLLMELEHSCIKTNGIQLHIVRAGPKSGSPVIFLHGFLNSGTAKPNAQKGLVLTERFVISPIKIAQYG